VAASEASPASSGGDDALAAVRAALADRRWADALAAADATGALGSTGPALTGEDLEGLGEAAWWSGRLGDAIDLRERAVAAYLAEGERARAARVALHLASDHTYRSEATIAAGWVKRAERLLADEPPAPAHGWLARARLNRALAAGDVEAGLVHADEVMAIGSAIGDRDLEVMGLQDRGRVLVALGRVEEGLDALDEAVVAALAGEVSPYPAAAVFCNATIACEDLTDFRRAQAFADTAKRWCDRQAIAGFPGMCRVRRVELIALRGAWAQAESEARQACDELIDFSHAFAGEGFYQIGEIRRRMGDLAGAESAFTEAHRLGRDPQPGLALVRLDQGRPDAAAALIGRALAEPSLPALRRARLLPTEVVAALAVRDLGRAESATAGLEAIAASYGTDVLRAEALLARGLVAAAGGDAGGAVAPLREAVGAWSATEAPYEAAVARVALAEAYLAAGDGDAAALEASAAVSAFETLGASIDLARLRELAAGDAAPTAGAPGKAPRASATFMFTDIVGSTSLIDSVGDEAWGRLLAWHDASIRALLREHAGREIHHAGDGFFVAFESADGAVDCALAIRRMLVEHRRDHGFAPSVRIGLHTAEALRTASGYEGGGVHAAARIGALAGPDEVLASRSAIEAATRRVAHGAWRTERLRGLRSPVEVALLD
jgi:class 3 adenylate cyclase